MTESAAKQRWTFVGRKAPGGRGPGRGEPVASADYDSVRWGLLEVFWVRLASFGRFPGTLLRHCGAACQLQGRFATNFVNFRFPGAFKNKHFH